MSKKKQAATPDADQPSNALGLLGNGRSGRWEVSVDEALAGRKWYLEIDGPTTYLIVRLRRLSVIGRLGRFLAVYDAGKTFSLGRFGNRSVSLLWDNEGVPRCYLHVGKNTTTTLRLSLDAEDVRMLAEALNQAAEDLPEG